MNKMEIFSLSRHSRLFSVPDNNKDYLFVGSGEYPYYEEPYRAESYAIVYVREGSVRLNAGLTSCDVVAPSIITIGPSVIRYFEKNNDHLKIDVIFFKDSFLLERYSDFFFLFKYDFFGNNGLYVLPIKESYFIKITKIFELIQLTWYAENYYADELVRNYIFALVYEIDMYHRELSSAASVSLNGHPLFAKFRQLLSANYMQERKLDFYANHLFLTPKSLSAAIKKHTGKSAGKWIDNAITMEAKVLLQNKRLTVSQISEMLNFSDQSVFGKFFKANVGMPPMEYRKKFS
jgi:AraC family transcriptional activator of pobA